MYRWRGLEKCILDFWIKKCVFSRLSEGPLRALDFRFRKNWYFSLLIPDSAIKTEGNRGKFSGFSMFAIFAVSWAFFVFCVFLLGEFLRSDFGVFVWISRVVSGVSG